MIVSTVFSAVAEKEGEKGWGGSIPPPHFKMCCYGPV